MDELTPAEPGSVLWGAPSDRVRLNVVRTGSQAGPVERRIALRVHEKRLEIRWSDLDAFGHVNNAVYLAYLEECRDEWLDVALCAATDTSWTS